MAAIRQSFSPPPSSIGDFLLYSAFRNLQPAGGSVLFGVFRFPAHQDVGKPLLSCYGRKLPDFDCLYSTDTFFIVGKTTGC
ncbi:hypothetical protein, partial [Synechococcus sp. UW140]|uniref:hypothetical protein n=1 Tax=Synechococcus sp. UW140 TaxID=368503 RepID=UPI0025DBAF4A